MAKNDYYTIVAKILVFCIENKRVMGKHRKGGYHGRDG